MRKVAFYGNWSHPKTIWPRYSLVPMVYTNLAHSSICWKMVYYGGMGCHSFDEIPYIGREETKAVRTQLGMEIRV